MSTRAQVPDLIRDGISKIQLRYNLMTHGCTSKTKLTGDGRGNPPDQNMEYNNVFEVKQNIERFGIWYALWFHGTNRNALWTIFVASRMLKRETTPNAPMRTGTTTGNGFLVARQNTAGFFL
jgi:hypothetical protein